MEVDLNDVIPPRDDEVEYQTSKIQKPRPFHLALIYERDGDLNLSQLLCLILGTIGAIGFIVVVIFGRGTTVFEKIAAWSFLGATFASVLIASLPIAKAKILAKATLPGDIAKNISAAAPNVETSTDIFEITQQQTRIG